MEPGKSFPTPPVLVPTFKDMAFSLTQAVKDNLQQIAMRGVLLAEEDEVNKRIEICKACEFFMRHQDRCSKCGCYMNIKARLKVSKCPVSKW